MHEFETLLHRSSPSLGRSLFALAAMLCPMLLSPLLAPPLEAQFVGSVHGAIVCPESRCLAGLELILEGGTLPARKTKPDEKGHFYFGLLPVGQYTLTARHAEYSEYSKQVSVLAGLPRSLTVKLDPVLKEVIVVTSEPATAELASREPGTFLGRAELLEIPAASDPWQSGGRVAGLLSDRPPSALSGGAEDSLLLEGSGREDTTLAVDGVPVGRGRGDDPGRIFSTEDLAGMEVVTGGDDLRRASAGAMVNLVTRQPSDDLQAELHASAADRAWQPTAGSFAFETEDEASGLEVHSLGNPQSDSLELGGFGSGRLRRAEVGGFLSYRQRSYRQQVLGGGEEDDSIRHLGAKVDARALELASTVLSYFHGERENEGAGASPERSEESTLFTTEPSRLLKLEQQLTLGSDTVLSGRYSNLEHGHVGSPLGLEEDSVLGAEGIWSGSFQARRSDQASEFMQLQAFFFTTPRKRQHEIEVGASSRQLESSTFLSWGANNRILIDGVHLGLPLQDLVQLFRDSDTRVEQDFQSLWLQDRATYKNLRVDTALRYDQQRGRNLPSRVEANPLAPELLPAVEFGGDEAGFSWSSLTPRVGLTYGFGRQGRTVLRTSYSQFASTLYPDLVRHSNPAAEGAVTLRLGEDGSGLAEEAGILEFRGPDAYYSTLGRSPNATDPDLAPEETREVRFSLEHQVGRNWVFDLAVTQRQITDILEARRVVRDASGAERLAEREDYVLAETLAVELPGGEGLEVPVYHLAEGLEFTGGSMLTNGDRSQDYKALTLSFRRRLSHRWMLRGHAHWSDWRWRVGPRFQRFDDPTDSAAIADISGIAPEDTDGEVVSQPGVSAPYSSPLLLNSRWSFNLQGLLRVAPEKPWGFDLSANLYGRQGFPLPYLVTVPSSDLTVREVQATVAGDSTRLEDVHTVDLKVEKSLDFRGTRATFSLDAFNLLNADTVLDRERRLNGPRANAPREILSPRTLRLGLRLALR